jgi:hypothetical protein
MIVNYDNLSAEQLIRLYNKGSYDPKAHLASGIKGDLSHSDRQIKKVLKEKGQKYILIDSLDEVVSILSTEIERNDSVKLVIYPNCVTQTDHLVVKTYPSRRITHYAVGKVPDYRRGDLTLILEALNLPYEITFEYDK